MVVDTLSSKLWAPGNQFQWGDPRDFTETIIQELFRKSKEVVVFT